MGVAVSVSGECREAVRVREAGSRGGLAGEGRGCGAVGEGGGSRGTGVVEGVAGAGGGGRRGHVAGHFARDVVPVCGGCGAGEGVGAVEACGGGVAVA